VRLVTGMSARQGVIGGSMYNGFPYLTEPECNWAAGFLVIISLRGSFPERFVLFCERGSGTWLMKILRQL